MSDDGDALSRTWPGSGTRVRQRWARLTDADLDSLRGDSRHLVSRLQERYGYSRERAERECQEFVDALDRGSDRRARIAGARTMPSGNARAPGSPAPQSRTARSDSAQGAEAGPGR